MTSPQLVEVHNLGFAWHSHSGPRFVLRQVSFGLMPGEILAVLGPSGCGKTTLLRLLSRFLDPTEGTIGMRADAEAASGGQGVMFQDCRLVPWLNVRDNIRLAFECNRRDQPTGSNLLEQLLPLLKLTGTTKSLPMHLSGGMVERTALARSLVASPVLLLLDEPLRSTDYPARLVVEDFLAAFVRGGSRGMIVVTHDCDQAAALADRILVLPQAADAHGITLLHVPDHLRLLTPSQARVDPAMGSYLSAVLDALQRVTAQE